jgi:putative (di)nucleoside polyphosphate hydrolase
MTNTKPYRPNVCAIIVSSAYPDKTEIFIAERSDIEGVWQFPQGGIDRGESPEEALYRELKEEIGTDKIKIVAEYPDWIAYDFPLHVMESMKPFYGQTQRYYLVRLKKKAVVNLQTKHPEFVNYKYVSLDEAFSMMAELKKPVYTKAIEYFKSEGYL